MQNFCVVTSHKEIPTSEIAFLKNYLNAKRVDVLGSCGVQFHVHPENIKKELGLERSKKIDINFITEDERSVYLLASDMDGTVLEEECINEIADLVGVGSEVKSITELAMKESLNFEEALKRRLAFLRGTELKVLEHCLSEKINIRPGAAVLFKSFKKYFGKTAILSGGFTYFSDQIQKELEADFSFANVLECKENRLTGEVLGTIVNAEKKAELMKQLISQQGKNNSNVVAVGDGNNDLRMISESGVGISFKGSHQLNFSAKHVLKNSDISAILYLLGLREEQFVY